MQLYYSLKNKGAIFLKGITFLQCKVLLLFIWVFLKFCINGFPIYKVDINDILMTKLIEI